MCKSLSDMSSEKKCAFAVLWTLSVINHDWLCIYIVLVLVSWLLVLVLVLIFVVLFTSLTYSVHHINNYSSELHAVTLEWILSPKGVILWLYCSETSRVSASSAPVIRVFRWLTSSYKCLFALNVTVTCELNDLEEFVITYLYCRLSNACHWMLPLGPRRFRKSYVTCANHRLAQNYVYMQRVTMHNIWPYSF